MWNRRIRLVANKKILIKEEKSRGEYTNREVLWQSCMHVYMYRSLCIYKIIFIDDTCMLCRTMLDVWDYFLFFFITHVFMSAYARIYIYIYIYNSICDFRYDFYFYWKISCSTTYDRINLFWAYEVSWLALWDVWCNRQTHINFSSGPTYEILWFKLKLYMRKNMNYGVGYGNLRSGIQISVVQDRNLMVLDYEILW